MPANILNLPDYKVVRVEETDHDYHITAEVSNSATACPSCQSGALRGHGRNEQAAREADRGTRAGRETAARLLTQANAIKRGAPIPAFAKTPRK